MEIRDFFFYMGKLKAPHSSDPLSGYIQFITNYVGDEYLVNFCFDAMLNQVDFKQAEHSKWSAVCPDFSFIQFKNYRNEDVRIPLNEGMKHLVQQAQKNSNSDYIFENQSRLVTKIGAIILLSTGSEAYSLKTFSDFYKTVKETEDKKNIPLLNETRLCFEPWEENPVGLHGEWSPCSQLPAMWNFKEIDTLSKGISHLRESLLQGNLNCVCSRCKLKPVTAVEHLKQEVETRQLHETDHIARLVSLSQAYKETPLPPPDLRFRISGTSDDRIFVLNGIQGSSQMMSYVQKYDHSKEPGLLDWGCGCGRYSNHIIKKWPRVLYTGSDIDTEAIAWCNNNIIGGNFVVNSPYVPTSFANEQFSSVIASSVMTHLNKQNQLLWLKEIARILKPGGIFVVSVLGFTAAAQISGLKEKMKIKGIVDGYLDPALDGIAPQGYYRDVFQTEKYTRKYWSQFFEIKEYVHAGLMGYQDLVVLEKKELGTLNPRKKNWFKRVFGEE